MRGVVMVLAAAVLAGCAGPMNDSRFLQVKGTVVEEGGYPVEVRVIEVSPGAWDVQSMEHRFVHFTGVSNAMEYVARFRLGADRVMADVAGGKPVRVVNEIVPTQGLKIWRRYELVR